MGLRGPKKGSKQKRGARPQTVQVKTHEAHRAALRLASRVGALIEGLQSESARPVLVGQPVAASYLNAFEAGLIEAAGRFVLRDNGGG